MKSIKKMAISSILLAGVLSLTACKKDTEKPTINVTSPVQCSEHQTGTEVQLEAIFSDDVRLEHYEVFVADEDFKEDPSFQFHLNEDISGRQYSFKKSFIVPSNPPSWRYIFFTVTDHKNKK